MKSCVQGAVLQWCLNEVGSFRLPVRGGCMLPALQLGDLVWIAGPRLRPPAWGDVVLVRLPEGLRLHRLLWCWPRRASGRVWVTKADRSPHWDGRVAPGDVFGSVVGVERQGVEVGLPVVPAGRLLHGLLGAAAAAARRRFGGER